MARPGIDNQRDTAELEDKLEGVRNTVGKAAAIVGALLTLACLAGLLVLISRAAGSPDLAAQALKSIPMLQKGLQIGLFALLVGTSLLFWGEEIMLFGHVVLALALYFAPMYVPSLFGGASNKAVDAGVTALASSGAMYGGLTLVLVIVEVFGRVRNRMTHGAKADTIKYGKGIKEEGDRKNQLMGNCWQLPYCRKFVRERCPIFHAKTTCWKELTGCMCEESVIRSAMENRPIPKDAVAAAATIPRNRKLTDAQKRSRCKSCVIYNEHQRHKYRVSMPVLLLLFGGGYVVLREQLVAGVSRVLGQANDGVNSVVLTQGRVQFPTYFVEVLVAGLVIVAISYAIRGLEYALFKLKI